MPGTSDNLLWMQNPELAAALRRRQMGEALLKEGTDNSPIKSPWQGANRLAQALMGGYETRKADDAVTDFSAKRAEMSKGLMAPFSGEQPSPLASSGAGERPPIYGQALPPAGVGNTDEDWLVRTTYGEARGESPEGQRAVAAVIRNRARAAGMPIKDVVLAPGQFEPWGNVTTRAQLEGLKPDSPEYQTILANLRASQDDPTGGATHFYSPTAQAALGRPAPEWATGEGKDIGAHRFYNLPYGGPRGGGGTVPVAGPGGGAQPAGGPRAAGSNDMAEAQYYEQQAMKAQQAGMHQEAALLMQRAQRAQQVALARQPSEMVVVPDPSSPSGYRYMPRQQAGGMAAPEPRPMVSIDQKGEGSFAVDRGKTFAARATGWEDAETKANDRLRTVARFRSALDNVETGFGTQTQITLGQIAQKLGVPEATLQAAGWDKNTTASREEVRAYAGKMLLESLGPGGFPTQGFSNADRDFLQSVLPGLLNSREGNKALLAVIEESSKRDKAVSRAWRDWRRTNGESPDSVRRFEDEKLPSITDVDVVKDILDKNGWKEAAPAGDANIPLVSDPADAAKLPPGTQFRVPDGRTLRAPAR